MDLRYPIGQFDFATPVRLESRPELIEQIAATPAALREAVAGLSDQQLETPYRDGGWTLRQVVHHVADSHVNSYIRFRLALTEDNPPAKGYNEAKWAELPDAKSAPVETSLGLLENIHLRWVALLRAMKPDDFLRTFEHSQMGRIRLDTNLGLYAWHGRHHIAHITGLRERMGW